MNQRKFLSFAFCFGLISTVLAPIPSSAAPVDELLNSSFEQQGGNLWQAQEWQNFGAGYTRFNVPHTGRWAARMTLPRNSSGFAGAYQRVDFQQSVLKPVFIGGWVKGVGITNNNGYFGAGLYVEIHLTDGQVVYWNSTPNYGTFDWRYIGLNTSALFVPLTAPIDYIFVIPLLGQASGTAYFDDIIVKEYEPTQTAVTLMFDDGEANAYTAAKPLMDKYGFTASVSVPSSVVGTAGYLNRTQLLELQRQGWEIVSHGVNHEDLTQMTEGRARQELILSKAILTALGLKVKNFALPFGAYNGFLLGEGQKYYRSIRAFELGDNAQGAFPYDVKVRGVIETTTPEQVEAWLTEAQTNRRWLVLVFHTIADTGDDVYHTSPAMLEQILDKVAASGLPVITYDRGLDMFAHK